MELTAPLCLGVTRPGDLGGGTGDLGGLGDGERRLGVFVVLLDPDILGLCLLFRLGVMIWVISGAGGGGRKRSLIMAVPSLVMINSGSVRPARNSSSSEPNISVSLDFDKTTDREPSGDLWIATDPLLFLVQGGETTCEAECKLVLDSA